MKAVFLDRDGTVNVGTPTYERVDSLEKVELFSNTIEALTLLSQLDYAVFFVTNQAGLSEGLINQQGFDDINDKILTLIEPSGVIIIETYVCPHGEDDACECRKPKPKLLQDAAVKYGIDLGQSFMVGDRHSDVMTAVNAGAKGILVKSGVQSVESPEAVLTAPSLLEAIQYISKQ